MASRPKDSLTSNLPINSNDRLKPLKSLIRFGIKRESIRLKRKAGLLKPWSNDSILNKYKFTNVCREYDKVSLFIYNWVKPVIKQDDLLLLNLLIARHINKPTTFNHINLTDFSNNNDMIDKIRELKPMFANPYQCPAQYKTINGFDTREEWIFSFFPNIVNQTLPILSTKKSIQEITDNMADFWGWNNGFASMQALLDLGHLRPDLVNKNSMINAGPGALPALKLLDMDLTDLLKIQHIKKLTGGYANTEHLLCEWRKYLELKHNIRKKTKGLEYKQ